MNKLTRKSFIETEFFRHKEKRRFFFLPFVLVLFTIVFTEKMAALISTVLVGPLSSSIKRSTLSIEIICVLITGWILTVFIVKGWKQIKLSLLLEAAILSVGSVYLYFRLIEHHQFSYVPFAFIMSKSVCLADIVVVPLIGLFLYYVIFGVRYSIGTKSSTSDSHGFYADSALALNESNDLLGRLPRVHELTKKILATANAGHSFAVGIIGMWGSGKTTFLNSVEQILYKESDVVQFRFNPWVARTMNGISTIFFKDLSAKLSLYDDSLKTDILSYSDELLRSVENSQFAIVKTFFSLFAKDRELEERFELLNQSIQSLRKKIVIFIDDVDRLDKDEVIEVLRIIRNTANFGNTFFIVAFDKVYVTDSIRQSLGSDTEEYLEKIFQLEYYLPLNPNGEIFKEALLVELSKYTGEENTEVIDKIRKDEDVFSYFEILPPIKDYIRTFRDVQRFMNIFLLNYSIVKNNIYLPDYISICILRLKYPEVYHALYYDTYRYLMVPETTFSKFQYGALFLKFNGKDDNNLEDSVLHQDIKANPRKFALNPAETSNVIKLVGSIFIRKNQWGISSPNRTLRNNHLTISDSGSFSRYFDFSMFERLDQSVFEAVFSKDLSDLETEITTWNNAAGISTDLQLKLENFTNFSNRMVFEKVIRTIVLFANLPSPHNPIYFNMFVFDNFYAKFRSRGNDSNTVLNELYQGDKIAFKRFFESLYDRVNPNGRWGFQQEFAWQLIRDYGDNFILSHAELKEMLKRNFFDVINAFQSVNEDILRFYAQLLNLGAKIDSQGNRIFSDKTSGEITDKCREIVEKDFRKFLGINLNRDQEGRYSMVGWESRIYGSVDEFESYLNGKKNERSAEEFARFIGLLKQARTPVSFEFKEVEFIR